MQASSHNRSLRIVQINTYDRVGGAARVAYTLHRAFLRRGMQSLFLVARKRGTDPDIIEWPPAAGRFPVARVLWGWAERIAPGSWWRSAARVLLRALSDPIWIWQYYRGIEYLRYPAFRRLFQHLPWAPQVLLLHNLHGFYFDLRMLSTWSRRLPVVLVLHDAWLFTGHCAHPMDCDRWRSGCGRCPDLDRYPAVKRDATHRNWRRKARIYRQARLYIVTPCQWLMNLARASILGPAVVEARVIPNGVDTETFRPMDRQKARVELDLAASEFIALYTASGLRGREYKDIPTLQKTVRRIAEKKPEPSVRFLVLGDAGETWSQGNVTLQFVPRIEDPDRVARYFQAADIYLHAARAETFPNTILEALACGTPVVATAVGGIVEQVQSLHLTHLNGGLASQGVRFSERDGATGILVPPASDRALAEAMWFLLQQPEIRGRLSENAVRDARRRFSLEHQVDAYLAWFQEILATSSRSADRFH